jgi:putative ABC transport system permease protein
MFDLSWKIAYKNLARNQRRTIATGIAMTAGFIGLILLGAYIFRVQRALEANAVYIMHAGHISIYKSGAIENFYNRPSKFIISLEDQQQLNPIFENFQNDIEMKGSYLSGMGLISNGVRSVPFNAVGIIPEVDFFIRHHPFVKTWAKEFLASQEDLLSATKRDVHAVSLTQTMSELLGRTDEISKMSADQKSLQLAAQNFQRDLNATNVSLELRHTTGTALLDATSIYTSLQVLQDLYATDGVSHIALFLKDNAHRKNILQKLNSYFQEKNLPLEAHAFNTEKISAFYTGTMSFLYVMAAFFVFLICGAVILSIVNSMTMGILERTKEIGTLRAIGFQPQKITFLFVKESILLTGISCSLGLIFSIIIAFIVNSMNIKFQPPGTSQPMQFVLAPNLILCVLIILLFSLVSFLTSYFVVKSKTQVPINHLLTDSGA